MPQKSRRRTRPRRERRGPAPAPVARQATVPEAPAPARPGPTPTAVAISPRVTTPRQVAPTAPTADYSHIRKELKTLGIIWGAMFAFLIILSFFIH